MAGTARTASTKGGLPSTQSKLQGLVAEYIYLSGIKKAEKGLEKYLKDPTTKAIAQYAKVGPDHGIPRQLPQGPADKRYLSSHGVGVMTGKGLSDTLGRV